MATVGLLYNLGKEDPPEEGEPPDIHAELDGEKTVHAVADALRWAGHEVVLIEGTATALDLLRGIPIDIAFNMCEGLRGGSRESQIPAILEMLGIPYAGSDVLTLAVALDKAVAKKLFTYHHVPTPAFVIVPPGTVPSAAGLRFPLFVKPVGEGSSMGISPNSLVRDAAELVEQVNYLHRYYRQAVLVEEYIDGREFTIGLIGNSGSYHIFPIMEINFEPCPPEHRGIYSFQFKRDWDDSKYYLCPAPVDDDLAVTLRRTAVAAFEALGCRDVGRVDIRLGRDGVPYVLEVNPLPGLTPAFSDLPRVALAEGMSFERLVNSILDCALDRYGLVHLKSRICLAGSLTA